MRISFRFASTVALPFLVACGPTDTTDPNVVHVANLSYIDTACGPVSCDGMAEFQLLNSANDGRAGLVFLSTQGPQPGVFAVNTRPDGWGWVTLTVDRASRPSAITACPEGADAGSSRCARGSTGVNP